MEVEIGGMRSEIGSNLPSQSPGLLAELAWWVRGKPFFE